MRGGELQDVGADWRLPIAESRPLWTPAGLRASTFPAGTDRSFTASWCTPVIWKRPAHTSGARREETPRKPRHVGRKGKRSDVGASANVEHAYVPGRHP